MHRIEGANFLEIAGKKYFANGPPGTSLADNWLNAVQEEIANSILDSDIILKTEAGETRTQLAQAILNRTKSFIMASGKGLDFSADAKGRFTGYEAAVWEAAATGQGSQDPFGGATEGGWIPCVSGLELNAALGTPVVRQQDTGANWVFGFSSTGYYVVFGHTLCTRTVGTDTWHAQQIHTSSNNGAAWLNLIDMAANVFAINARMSVFGMSQIKVTDISNDLIKWVTNPAQANSNNGFPRLVFVKIADI